MSAPKLHTAPRVGVDAAQVIVAHARQVRTKEGGPVQDLPRTAVVRSAFTPHQILQERALEMSRHQDDRRRTHDGEARDAVVLEECNRMAREIHDTLAQGYAAIRLQLELARGEDALPPQAAKAIDLAYQIATEHLVEARRAMSALKSNQPGLMASLSSAVNGVRRLSDARVIAAIEAVPAPPRDVAHELLRIAQEALCNASSHADAQTIQVMLTPAPRDGLRLAVIDDGKGFDPDAVSPGFGLPGLRERASAIRAGLSIASAPGAGTEVSVTWFP